MLGGVVNACYLVNDDLIVRLNVRDPHFPKLRNEAEAYRIIRETSVPVPEVITLDESRRIVPYDYLITTRLPGRNVYESRHLLDEHQTRELAWEAGKFLADLHEIEFNGWGKLSEIEADPFPNWPAYFFYYVKRYLRPAHRHNMLSVVTLSQLELIIDRYGGALFQVDRAVLVHSDYHYENILQVDGRITGIVDFEWCYAGDPSADFVPSNDREDMLPGSEDSFLEGYINTRSLPEGQEQRIALYRLFLELEMVVTYQRINNRERMELAESKLERLLGEMLS
jgi:aminoglycoside phosphotransferase (APT) family kinase protein